MLNILNKAHSFIAFFDRFFFPRTYFKSYSGCFVPLCVSVGLFFSISTHLRGLVGGFVGPGEFIMLFLALFGVLSAKSWHQLRNPIIWFWATLVVTMLLGSLSGSEQGNWVIRNTLAYVFTGFVVVGFVLLFSRFSIEALRCTLALLCLVASFSMWFGFVIYLTADSLLIQKFSLNDLGDLRYAGWSANPNQLALFFIPLPVWLMALFRNVLRPNRFQTAGFGLLLIALMLMGLLVRSDGLLVVWALEFVVLLVLRLRWDLKVSGKSLFAYAFVMVLCVLLVKTFAHGEVRKSVHCAAKYLSKGLNSWESNCFQLTPLDGNAPLRIGYSDPLMKVGTREDLWTNGLNVWRRAPLFGNGPGAFSWYSNPDLQSYAEAEGKFREEAHNITIDLLTQGGVVLGLAWLGLLLSLLFGAWRIRDSYTFSVLLMIGVFTMFHYHLRQPYLWFVLIFSYEAIKRRLFVGGRH